MTGRAKITAVGLVAFLGLLIYWARIVYWGKILERSSSAWGDQYIQVVELPQDSHSIESMLGWGDPVYRVEYYRRKGEPMSACISISGESDYGGRFRIDWESPTTAVVKGEGQIFQWNGSEWSKSADPSL